MKILLPENPNMNRTMRLRREDDIFYFGYTSGTTGFPKGAMNTSRGTIDIIKNLFVRTSGRKGVDLSSRVFLAIIPICHSNSVWATLITFWVASEPMLCFPSGKYDPEKVLNIIEKEKVTTTSMVADDDHPDSGTSGGD